MAPATDHLRRVRELFDEVMDQPAGERDHYLANAPGWDPAVRREVASLLASADSADELLEPSSANIRNRSDEGAAEVGRRFGPYEVVRLIGTGGMGAVYEGVRADDQYRKRVAIKLVQSGLDSDQTLSRFRRERQILASLEHPHIATLLDGGAAPDGRPFLVMEYVEGAPITTWCNDRAVPVERRIELFRQVCEAVQHAHKNLVVHRDLKPGNILVTDDGSVKLLDFGIAKLLRVDETDATMPATRGEARSFTPEYASPEQILGGVLTTGSDVYSLGVILFELLAGRRPYVPATRALRDIEHAVLEEAVPRPSAVVTDEAARRTGERSAERLRRHLHGELDNIVLRAMRKEPERRYPSVEALSEDLRRHLAGLPVEAQSDWAGYRLQKFVRRNVGAVAASALVLCALVGGVIATSAQAHRARVAQAQSDQVNSFLRTLLSSVQPEIGRRDVQVSEVLDSAARRLDREPIDQPEVRADLESVIGESYSGLGRFDDAQKHLTAGLKLREQTGSRDVVTSMSDLGQLFMAKGVFDSAEQVFQRALTVDRTFSRAPDSSYASLLTNLASLAHNQGKPKDAERLHRESLAIRRKVLKPNDDLIAMSINDVAVAVGEQGRLAEAEALHREALQRMRATHPEPSVQVASILNALATILDWQGKAAEAESTYHETLALRRQLLGAQHPDYTFTLFNYAMMIFEQKRYREAAEYSRQILALRGGALPESHPSIAAALQTLGRCLDHLGDSRGGEQALLESLALRKKYVGPKTWLVASSEGMLGEHYTFLKEYPQAERTLLQAQALFAETVGETNARAQANVRRLVTLYTAWGKPAKAAEFSAKLPKPGAAGG